MAEATRAARAAGSSSYVGGASSAWPWPHAGRTSAQETRIRRSMAESYDFGGARSKKTRRARPPANLRDRRMRLVFSSDLHVEHHPQVAGLIAARARRLGAEVLVIAGDVGGR